MGDEDDGLLQLRLKPHELVLDPLAVDRVDGAERLVHQQHRRVGGQGTGHADALLLAARELLGIALAELARVEADQLQQLVDRARCDAAAGPTPAAAGPSPMFVGDRLVREQPDLLDDVADAAAQLDGIDAA